MPYSTSLGLILSNWNFIIIWLILPHFLLPTDPGNALLLWLWLFYIPHISDIMDLDFCVWLISLSIKSSQFIHVITNSRISFFLRVNNVPLCVYPAFSLSIFYWGIPDLWYYISFRCTTQWFSVLTYRLYSKFTIKCWLYSLCCKIYPCAYLLYAQYLVPLNLLLLPSVFLPFSDHEFVL